MTASAHRNDHASALIILGMQQAAVGAEDGSAILLSSVCAQIERARAVGDQVIFVQWTSAAAPEGSDGWKLIAPLVPVFPDWVIQASARSSGASIFDAPHLTAQLKAAGITRLTLVGLGLQPSLAQALALGFVAELVAEGAEFA